MTTFPFEITVQEAAILLDCLVNRRVHLDTFRYTATINGSVNAEKMIEAIHAVEKKLMFAALLAGAKAKQEGDSNDIQ